MQVSLDTEAYSHLHADGGLYNYTSTMAYPVAYGQGNLDVPDLTYDASSPEYSSASSIASPRTPNATTHVLPPQRTVKKSKSRKSKDPDYVARPPNAFMLFRSAHNAMIQTHNAPQVNQQDISRAAAEIWRSLSDEKKQPFLEAAAEKNRAHRISNPNGSYRKRSKTSIKCARDQNPYDRPPNMIAKRAKTKKDTMPPEMSFPAPLPLSEQWPQPSPPQFIDPMLTQQHIPSNVVVDAQFEADDSQFGLRLDLTIWPPVAPVLNATSQFPTLAYSDQGQSLSTAQDETALTSVDFNEWLLLNEPTISGLDDQIFEQFLNQIQEPELS